MLNHSARAITLLLLATPALAQAPYELVLRGGRVVDGAGAPWYFADVGIREGKITHIGRLNELSGERVIDATGLVHAAILRLQALILPVRTLVLSGGH